MNIINIGTFYCKYCKKDIGARVYTDNPKLVLDYKDEAVDMVENFHWYDHHYNCAVCGKWIPSGERELAFADSYPKPIHPTYNIDARDGLLRVHRQCIEKGGES